MAADTTTNIEIIYMRRANVCISMRCCRNKNNVNLFNKPVTRIYLLKTHRYTNTDAPEILYNSVMEKRAVGCSSNIGLALFGLFYTRNILFNITKECNLMTCRDMKHFIHNVLQIMTFGNSWRWMVYMV